MRRLLAALVGGALLVGAGPAFAYTDTDIYSIASGWQNTWMIGDSVRVTNVAVVGVDVRPGTYGVYIQEQGGGAYSGILAYRNTVFPAYENSADPVTVGDVIQVEGILDEFDNLKEIVNPILNKLGTTAPLAPEVLPTDSLKTSYGGSERWEGVLVRVENVIADSVGAFSQVYIRAWTEAPTSPFSTELSVYEKMVAGQLLPVPGDSLQSITGVLDTRGGERRIAPRDDDDIVFHGVGPAPVPDLAYSISENQIRVYFNVPLDPGTAEDDLNYVVTPGDIIGASYDDPTQSVTLTTIAPLVPSTTPHRIDMSGIRNSDLRIMEGVQSVELIGGIATIPFIQNPVSMANDTSQVNGQQVSFRGVVTASGDGVDFPGGLGFYVQERGTAEYAGIFVFGSPTVPARNDSVFVSGIVTEFGVGPETEIVSVDEVTILASGVTPVAPVDRTLTQISGSNLAEAEKYESSLVRVQNVTVISSNFIGSPFEIVDTDTMLVDDLAVQEDFYQPLFDDVVDVTGVIRFSGSAPFRRLQPRHWDEPPVGDIHVVSKSAVSDVPDVRWRTALFQNDPNPFNPTTRIRFTIGNAGPVSLRIYDLRGRHVATLFDEHRAAGPGQIVWDGHDDSGRKASSGVYWYRLSTTGSNDHVRKMVLLK